MKSVATTAADAPRPASSLSTLLGEVEQYYANKILAHGATPLGVDWSCTPTQEMRFVQLLKVCEFDAPVSSTSMSDAATPGAPISINDIGCGYGALLAFLRKRHRNKKIDYLGVDISAPMIACAQNRWKPRADASFAHAVRAYRTADYSVASGVFNVKLSQPVAAWERMIEQTLRDMHVSSRLGFAVNFLAPMPDGVSPIAELYRAPPEIWSEFCERALNVNVELIDNYGMREYTLLARKKSVAPG